MGQTGCPETYSQEFCCGQSMSPADVQKTPSTGGRGPPASTADRREELPKASPQGQIVDLGATAYSAISTHLLGTFHVVSTLETRQRTPKAELLHTPRHHSGSKVGTRCSQEALEMGMIPTGLTIRELRSAIACHLACHTTCRAQDSISASPG